MGFFTHKQTNDGVAGAATRVTTLSQTLCPACTNCTFLGTAFIIFPPVAMTIPGASRHSEFVGRVIRAADKPRSAFSTLLGESEHHSNLPLPVKLLNPKPQTFPLKVLHERRRWRVCSLWLQVLLAFGCEIPLCVPFTSGHHFCTCSSSGTSTKFFFQCN